MIGKTCFYPAFDKIFRRELKVPVPSGDNHRIDYLGLGELQFQPASFGAIAKGGFQNNTVFQAKLAQFPPQRPLVALGEGTVPENPEPCGFLLDIRKTVLFGRPGALLLVARPAGYDQVGYFVRTAPDAGDYVVHLQNWVASLPLAIQAPVTILEEKVLLYLIAEESAVPVLLPLDVRVGHLLDVEGAQLDADFFDGHDFEQLFNLSDDGFYLVPQGWVENYVRVVLALRVRVLVLAFPADGGATVGDPLVTLTVFTLDLLPELWGVVLAADGAICLGPVVEPWFAVTLAAMPFPPGVCPVLELGRNIVAHEDFLGVGDFTGSRIRFVLFSRQRSVARAGVYAQVDFNRNVFGRFVG